MIPTYNCADYLRETLCSVLNQDPGPEIMQIEVVDDCSTKDDPQSVVQEVGQGRVAFYRQAQNVGHVCNFNTALSRARGYLVHLLHGDDCVRPGFYDTMVRPFNRCPQLGAAFCRDIRIDEDSNWRWISRPLQRQSGLIENWLELIGTGQRLQTPSIVVRREVYEHLGGFDKRIRTYGEDWEMWVRIAAHYPVWYELKPLALYRIHTSSLSGRAQESGQHGEDLRLVIELNRAHLPPERVTQITDEARMSFARACLRRGHRLLDAGEGRGALVQGREALRTSRAPVIWAGGALLGARWVSKRLTTAGRQTHDES